MDYETRVYANAGNPAVVALVDPLSSVVLDVGCGAGDNASLLKARDPSKQIYGITASKGEAALAGRWMEACWVADLEQPLPSEVIERDYDVIVCSHVLEHLVDPASAVARLSALLKPGGSFVIAVPNVLSWRQRLRFLFGRFEYEQTGVLDETHLRFFTYFTAPNYLLAKARELRVVEQRVTGSVPLWILRRHVFSSRLAEYVDRLGCLVTPNLVGSEILIKAVRD